MKKSLIAGALLLVSSSLLSGCVIHVGNTSALDGDSVSSLLGNIDIAEHKHAGDISSVNGNVEISDHASADDISIVNGNLEMESHVTVDRVDIVNGDVSAVSHLTVINDVETVNGNVTLPEQSKIGGIIETVNGDIVATDTVIQDNIETINGDVTLKGHTHVAGDIVYKERDSSWGKMSDDKPTLTIGKNVVLDGNIVLERPVLLDFEDNALKQKVIVNFAGAQ